MKSVINQFMSVNINSDVIGRDYNNGLSTLSTVSHYRKEDNGSSKTGEMVIA